MMNQYQLRSKLNSYVILEMLRDDYRRVLSSKALVSDEISLVPINDVAEFWSSKERLAMDREYQHNKMMNLQMKNQDSGDGTPDYKGRLD